MKLTCALLFLSLFVGIGKSHADDEELLKEITLESEDYSLEASYETKITQDSNQRRIDLFNLQKAKFKIISGDLTTAAFYLNRISENESIVTGIKKRYMAMIYFIEGRYAQSIKELNDKRVNNNNYYTQTCLLRLINFMAVNDIYSIEHEKKSCQFYTAKFSKNDQFWLDAMINLKINDTQRLKRLLMSEDVVGDDEASKLWLKTGLYLNKEKQLLEQLALLSESSYQSKKLREIVAFMYLRQGETKKALSFVDDIDTANAENIKGNVNLANKEYELAFGHFRLALQKKQDSANALERAIPLAWLLSQFGDGLSMLSNVSNKNLDPRNSQATKIAFLIREKRFLEAQRELTLLKIAFQNEPPFEVSIMDTYVNLILSSNDKAYDKRKIEESAEKSCKAFDGISCWISLQYIQWENLGKTLERDDPVYSDTTMTVESLKEKKVLEPLIETKSIDQSDIEELDGETIKISPK
ncbi:MAG: hypothetical protein H7177_12105 [Rhizobacter sp.]|nr:hypothetical protein [Bacteriovorax sp.]